jgi:CHAT domain-containing protein
VSMYRNLRNGMTKAEALQHAKLELMNGVSEGSNGRKYANIQPFLWAPFEFYGAP